MLVSRNLSAKLDSGCSGDAEMRCEDSWRLCAWTLGDTVVSPMLATWQSPLQPRALATAKSHPIHPGSEISPTEPGLNGLLCRQLTNKRLPVILLVHLTFVLSSKLRQAKRKSQIRGRRTRAVCHVWVAKECGRASFADIIKRSKHTHPSLAPLSASLGMCWDIGHLAKISRERNRERDGSRW